MNLKKIILYGGFWMSIMSSVPIKIKSIKSSMLDGKRVLFYNNKHKRDFRISFLNDTAIFILDLIDGDKTVNDIARAIKAEYNIDIKTAELDVKCFIKKLKKTCIIRFKNEF